MTAESLESEVARLRDRIDTLQRMASDRNGELVVARAEVERLRAELEDLRRAAPGQRYCGCGTEMDEHGCPLGH